MDPYIYQVEIVKVSNNIIANQVLIHFVILSSLCLLTLLIFNVFLNLLSLKFCDSISALIKRVNK